MSTTKDDAYFAPPAGPMPEGEPPAWGEDAEAIARTAGLGSYGPTDAIDQQVREDALVQAIGRTDGELRALRKATIWLAIVVAAVTAVVVGLVVRGH